MSRTLLVQLYGRLASLHPRAFRATFASEMQQVFAAQLTAVPFDKPWSVVALCSYEFRGLFQSIAREHWKEHCMTRPIATLPQALLVAALLINFLLVLIVVEGAAVLQTAAASNGGALPCVAWYNHPVVNDHFADGRWWRANVLYALSVLFPAWLLGIAAVAIALRLSWRGQRPWLPLATLGPLVPAVAILWPIVQTLGCALE